MAMHSYTTERHGAAAKLGYSNEVLREVFRSPWELQPSVPLEEFLLTIRSARFGDLALTHSSLSQVRIRNEAAGGPRSGEYPYSIYMVDRRQGVAMEHTQAVLQPGDFTLVDSARPAEMLTEQAYNTVALIVPRDILREYVPTPDLAVGLRFSGSLGLSRAASIMLGSLWSLVESEQITEVGTKLARSFLELFAVCCHVECGGLAAESSSVHGRRAQVKRFIEDNLRDPDLAVEAIAQHFGISTRSLQVLFAAEQETVSGYIRSKRLEGCRMQLADPLWRHRGITEIAFRWGFNDATHFARAFRERFGMSAREFRLRLRK
jgi:AraC-like DNA-binding protein